MTEAEERWRDRPRPNDTPGCCAICEQPEDRDAHRYILVFDGLHLCESCCREREALYRSARKSHNAAARERGTQEWAERGIRVGQKVRRFCPSMLGIGGVLVRGTAKVGAVGAYVQSPYQHGYLTPDGWELDV